MKRREFISLLGGAVAAWPLAVTAQEPGRAYRLGLLVRNPRDTPEWLAFFDELRLSGFIEGQNLALVAGGFDVPIEQFASRAAAIVKGAPDVIISVGDVATRVVREATSTIPIVVMAEDMVAAGLVASLARPGGNVTGISLLSPELDGKRQDILIEAVPDARRIAALADPTVTPPGHAETLREAVRARGIELSVFTAARPEAIGSALDAAKASGAEAVNVLATPLFANNRQLVIERVAALRLPAIYQWPEIAEEGGFAAYGPRLLQLIRQRARIVAKILRGAKPTEIPVEQPTHFELVINLKAAKTIGHEIPAGLVLRADKVIE
jgi:ABC-type uncharacterized transport system substrate-binding protein